jgi:hypothetical protein
LRHIDVDKPGEGDPVRLKTTGEMGECVHVFTRHPFKGDVVVLVGERRELVSLDEVERVSRREGTS